MAGSNGTCERTKVQTFCNLVFGNNYEIWNRDIDRYIPEWIVTKLSEKSGISAEKIDRTSLRRFQDILFDKVRPSGHLTWVNSFADIPSETRRIRFIVLSIVLSRRL